MTETSKSLEEFDSELAKVHMRGQWQYDRMLGTVIGGPKPAGVPAIWRWNNILEKLVESCDVLEESFTARRNLTFINPALERGTTHTIAMGMQMLKPGEIAWAHRHTIAALRFAIQGGDGLSTVVDGEICPMEAYDLVLTPRWTWHDHENATGDHAIWLDVLDLGLVMSLNAIFYEPFGDERQPKRADPADYLAARAGSVRPVWERRRDSHVPIRYPWRDIEPRLVAMAGSEGSSYDGIALEYANPMTGGPTLPTLSCWIQLLRSGEETLVHRHTSSSVYFVVRGTGRVVVDETEIEWTKHDAFVIPNWSWHRFINDSKEHDAILFSVNDIPTLKALDLYFEEPELSLASAPWPAVPGNLTRDRRRSS